MYAVVNALNEQVGWMVGPLEVKVCSLVEIFQTWCNPILQIHAKSLPLFAGWGVCYSDQRAKGKTALTSPKLVLNDALALHS